MEREVQRQESLLDDYQVDNQNLVKIFKSLKKELSLKQREWEELVNSLKTEVATLKLSRLAPSSPSRPSSAIQQNREVERLKEESAAKSHPLTELRREVILMRNQLAEAHEDTLEAQERDKENEKKILGLQKQVRTLQEILYSKDPSAGAVLASKEGANSRVEGGNVARSQNEEERDKIKEKEESLKQKELEELVNSLKEEVKILMLSREALASPSPSPSGPSAAELELKKEVDILKGESTAKSHQLTELRREINLMRIQLAHTQMGKPLQLKLHPSIKLCTLAAQQRKRATDEEILGLLTQVRTLQKILDSKDPSAEAVMASKDSCAGEHVEMSQNKEIMERDKIIEAPQLELESLVEVGGGGDEERDSLLVEELRQRVTAQNDQILKLKDHISHYRRIEDEANRQKQENSEAKAKIQELNGKLEFALSFQKPAKSTSSKRRLELKKKNSRVRTPVKSRRNNFLRYTSVPEKIKYISETAKKTLEEFKKKQAGFAILNFSVPKLRTPEQARLFEYKSILKSAAQYKDPLQFQLTRKVEFFNVPEEKFNEKTQHKICKSNEKKILIWYDSIFPNRVVQRRPQFQRKEADVGITLRIGTQPRFNAIVKQRYSDFYVNEIDPDGQIVRLTTLDPPPQNCSEVAVDDPDICTLIPQEIRQAVFALHDKISEGNNCEKEFVNVTVTKCDKPQRTKIRKWINSFDKLSSETMEQDGDKFIKIIPMTKNLRPGSRGKYTHCVLYKVGWDTSKAVEFIAKKLNLKPGFFSYAGIKDKVGNTTQRLSVSNIDASRLAEICKYSTSLQLGNFSYGDKPLCLGDLKGNHFRIALKEVENGVSEEEISAGVDSLRNSGFINYFGMQRFGTYEIATWQVGKLIMQQQWMQAFDLILTPKPNDCFWMSRAKNKWLSSRDPSSALKEIPFQFRHSSVESNLIQGLGKFYAENDFLGAFMSIPRAVRLLYTHAYRSYLWNQMVSFRIREYGHQPVAGDLIFLNNSAGGDEEQVIDEVNLGVLEEDDPSALSSVAVDKVKEVRHLTEEDVASGKYRICDVVLPLFGADFKTPLNKTGDFLRELLQKEGMDDPQLFTKFRPIVDKPLGTYRKMIVIPENVSFAIRYYNEADSTDDFISSDLSILQTGSSASAESLKEKGEKRCVILELSLPSSSYATMALRELLN